MNNPGFPKARPGNVVVLATLLAGFSILVPGLAGATPALKVELQETVVAPGEVVHGTIRVGSVADPVQDLLGVGFRMIYSGIHFNFASSNSGPFLGGVGALEFVRASDATNNLAYAISRPGGSGASGTGVICTFELTVSQTASDGLLVLSLYSVQAINSTGGSIALQVVPGSIEVRGDPSSTPGGGGPRVRMLGAPTPNPASSRFQVGLSLPSDENLQIELVDVSGRIVRSLAEGHYGVGSHSLEFDLNFGQRPGAGVYFLRLTAGGRQETRRLAVVR